jgi:hypothetical protein
VTSGRFAPPTVEALPDRRESGKGAREPTRCARGVQDLLERGRDDFEVHGRDADLGFEFLPVFGSDIDGCPAPSGDRGAE